MSRTLRDTSWRAGHPNREGEIASAVRRLTAQGGTAATLAELWAAAQAKTDDDPGALLDHWLERPLAARRATKPAKPASHVPNMPLGAACCLCAECVAARERGGAELRRVE